MKRRAVKGELGRIKKRKFFLSFLCSDLHELFYSPLGSNFYPLFSPAPISGLEEGKLWQEKLEERWLCNTEYFSMSQS